MMRLISKPEHQLLYISVSFLVLLTAFNSVQSLVVELYLQMGYRYLGKLNLFFYYLIFTISSFFAANLVQQWGFRASFFFGTLAMQGMYLVGLFMSYCVSPLEFSDVPQQDTSERKVPGGYCDNTLDIVLVNLLSYSLGGAASAVMWNAVSGYISSISKEENFGNFFGIFFSISSCSLIFGSILPTYTFSYLNLVDYFLIVMVISLASLVLFYFTPETAKHIYTESGLNRPLMIQSMRGSSAFSDSPALAQSPSLGTSIRKTIRILRDEEVQTWTFLFFLSGYIQAMIYGFLYKFGEISYPMMTYKEKDIRLSIMFIFLAVAEVIGGWLVGKAIDLYGIEFVIRKILIKADWIMIIASFVQCFAQSFYLAIAVAVLLGFCDNAITTIINGVVKNLFIASLDYFGVYRVTTGTGLLCGFLISLLIENYIVGVVLIFAFINWQTTLKLAHVNLHKDTITELLEMLPLQHPQGYREVSPTT